MAKVSSVFARPRLPWQMMDADGCAEVCLMVFRGVMDDGGGDGRCCEEYI